MLTNNLNQYIMLSVDDITDFIPEYDADGNQTRVKTSTGIWAICYNAENRPTDFTKVDSSGSTTIHCEYDYIGRRATKQVSVNGNVTLHQRYLYRGYLQIACVDLARAAHPALWFITWDPTQSIATRPLAIRKDGTWYAYGWDFSKNICEIFGPAGYIRTSYTYAPCGEVVQNGNVVQPIQWSSEYYEQEMSLSYYNYRYYNCFAAKWLSRDKLNEKGGVNLYNYVKNNTIKEIDILGNIAWVLIIPCIKGMAISAVSDVSVQECKCCYKQVGWRLWKCDLGACPPINVCSVIVSAIVGCAAGYIPAPIIPTTVTDLRLLAQKTGASAFAKWLGKFNC